MATLHQYSTKSKAIVRFSTDNANIRHLLSKFGIKFDYCPYAEVETLTESLAFQHGYVTTDLFQTEKPRVMDPHFHEDREARLILKGTGTFFVVIPEHEDDNNQLVDEMVFELTVGPGDFVSIPDRTIHGFESNEPTVVARFFTKTGDYKAHYVTW